MRNGIIGGGNLVVDQIKIVDYYPNKNMMCNIVSELITAVGGGPHNVLVNLAKLETGISLSALGLVGQDNGGELIIKTFKDNNVDTSMIQKIDYKNTSFTDVITEISTGDRTFMHYPGANSELDFGHFEKAKNSTAKIFYTGNLLHLDKLDSDDSEFGLISARVLNYLTEVGFKTSADMVSVKNPELFAKVFKYCLKHIDYFIMNEIEAQSLVDLNIRREDGTLDIDNLHKTAELIIKNGVRELCVIHYPEGGIAMDKNFKIYNSNAFTVDKSQIKSVVGCGDAFNAGILYGIHEGWSIEECLELANAMARFCLFDRTTTGGAVSLSTIKEFIKEKKLK